MLCACDLYKYTTLFDMYVWLRQQLNIIIAACLLHFQKYFDIRSKLKI